MGQQDDNAHEAFAQLSKGHQAKAHEKFAILTFFARHERAGLGYAQIKPLVDADKALPDCPARKTIRAWQKAVEGVDPANWAPVLAPGWKPRIALADISPEAWHDFKDRVGLSGTNGHGFNFKRIYRKMARISRLEGWSWPSEATVCRHWANLDPVERLTLEKGAAFAAKQLAMYQQRSLDGMFAMQQVELDGKEFAVTVTFEDGTTGCPWVIMFTDRASSRIVGWSVSTSENEEAASAAVTHMCDYNSIPDLVVTDNGSAFNGRRMAGGLKPRYRTKQQRAADWEVPGVLKIYGIELQNNAPEQPRAKIPESIFSAMRHVVNDPVFYKAQRSGPSDIPNPNPTAVPVSLFKALLAEEIADFNAKTDSRAKGLRKGESRDLAFERLSEGRKRRYVTPLQRRSVKLDWKLRTVMPDGRVKFDGGLFGDASTQSAMLLYAGKQVLVGIDPTDYSAPAVVREWVKQRGYTVLLDHLPCFAPAKHQDEASRRRAVQEKRRMAKLTKEFEVRDADMKVAALRSAVAAGATAQPPKTPTVISLDTRGPFSAADAIHKSGSKTADTAIPRKFLENLKEDTRRKLAEGQ